MINEKNLDQELLNDIYLNLKEDYMGFWVIYSLIKGKYIALEKNILDEHVLKYIEYLLQDEDVKSGDFIKKENGSFIFKIWNLPIDEKVNKFVNEWKKIDFNEPDIGDVCFFVSAQLINEWGTETVLDS